MPNLEPKPEFDHAKDVFGEEALKEARSSVELDGETQVMGDPIYEDTDAAKEVVEEFEKKEYPTDEDGIEPEKVGEDSEPVLIRIAEWTEWVPGRVDANMKREHPDADFIVYNGITGVVSGKGEKLIDVQITSLNTHRKVVVDDETLYYKLYAIQATFAENVSAGLITGIQDSMLGPLHQQFEKEDEGKPQDGGRDRRKDLVVIERNRPEAVAGVGNRAGRRAAKKAARKKPNG